MAQNYDVSLKSLFLREGDGIIRRLLFGAKVIEYLYSEQPQVINRRADMVVRTEDRSLHQVEFQTTNEAGFPLRMLEYYTYLVRTYDQHVIQIVLYLGREPLRLKNTYVSPSMDFRFEIVNVRDFDAGPLSESGDWADNALSLLAKGEPAKALEALLPKLRAMEGEDQNWAAAILVLLSGILGIEESVNERLKEVGMINVMENKVLGPMIQQKFQQGLEQGLEQGREQGREQGLEQGHSKGQQEILLEQFTEKFGPLPKWAVERLQSASGEDLHTWAKRILRSTTLEDTLN